MLFRDYETAATASVGDLLAFDNFFNALPESMEDVLLRKIKHEVLLKPTRGFDHWDMKAAEDRGYKRGLAEAKRNSGGEKAS